MNSAQTESHIRRTPGVPCPNPTKSFWSEPPSHIARHRSPLPSHADVVIIGSGFTGTSVARTLLHADGGLQVVMLEAREVCSGATGRNGGHIDWLYYEDYAQLISEHGREMARKIFRFKQSHYTDMWAVAVADDVLESSQIRGTVCCNVYMTNDAWQQAKVQCATLANDMPLDAASLHVYEKEEAIEKFGLSSHTLGCISTPSGAIHPYRFVTGILSRLLDAYEGFRLLTGTPCLSISGPSSNSPDYTVHTPAGSLTASHVVHCTNAYAPHLVEGLRGKITPLRGTMTAQRPGTSFMERMRTTSEPLSFVFHDTGYDYLTQLPTKEHELILGGGLLVSGAYPPEEVGEVDDASVNVCVAAHLGGALPLYFGEENWGAEGRSDADGWPMGRVKALWTGIIGMSIDWLPWVGRIPPQISGRDVSPGVITRDVTLVNHLVPPGEWIAAGYSGEGGTQAWMCGKAVGLMILGQDVDWLPEAMLMSQGRLNSV